MTPEEVPQEYKELLDDAAGKRHSITGPVMECLAEILTRHEEEVRADERRCALQELAPMMAEHGVILRLRRGGG